jgi:class 3 adenylate cyclase/tetratricopeptide (TPR) repeat protein
MQCLSCQATLPETVKFCIECGAPAPCVCASCGFANLARAKFCAECAAKLNATRIEDNSSALPEAQGLFAADHNLTSVERRQLTVLFCDLVGSTLLSSRLDPEELRDVIGTYHRCIADTVERFDGFVARYMGDGALVYFGYPHSYEDNAERAVHAALALVSNIAQLNVLAERLHVRIGIATGVVVVGELVNAGAAREQTALGETPNLAARLQAFADPDTIVVADATQRLVSAEFECRDLGTIPLSGFATPVRAWQILKEGRSRRRFSAHDSSQPQYAAPVQTETRTLIGRSQELALLHELWRLASAGHGQAVLVTGDAGIGKSHLAQALLSHVAKEPHAYLECRCSALFANSPLYPVVALFPTVLGWTRDDGNEARFEKLEAFCARHHLPPTEAMPLLASLLSLPASDHFPLRSMSPERQRLRTLQLMVAIVVSFANEKPLVMVVEDLHWIDPTSTQLLAMLMDQVPTIPLFVLLTARPDFAPPWPSQCYVKTLVLAPLAPHETTEMVLRLASGKSLPPEVLSEIVSRTDGVPLFVEELTKMVLESDLVQAQEDRYTLTGPLPPLAIPTTLQDSLVARLDRLASAKPLAQLCATLGREFSYPLLQAVSGLGDVSLQRSLAQLLQAEFLRQRDTAEAVYTFKHALIQEAAYQSLLKSRRQQYHERIAHVICDRFTSDAEANPEVVALHHAQAGHTDAAIGWWTKAGQHAFRRASYPEAIAHYSTGLRTLESLPDERKRDQSELALQVELGYSLIPLRGWGAMETAQAFRRAGELSRQIGDTPSQFRALWGVGAFHFVRGDQHKALEVAEQCLDLARQADNEDALIEAHYLIGIVRCVRGDFVGGSADLETSIRLYGTETRHAHRVLYGQDAKASALGWLAMAKWVLGHPEEALARANEGLALVRDAPQPFLLARGLAGVGFIHLFRRDSRAADAKLGETLALCAEQGFTYFHAVVSGFKGANLVLLGDTCAGIELMQTSMQSLRAMGSELLLTLISASLASAQLDLGQFDAAIKTVDAGFRLLEQNGERWVESELHRLRGDLALIHEANPAQAELHFRKALAVARDQGAKSYELRAATALGNTATNTGKTASPGL